MASLESLLKESIDGQLDEAGWKQLAALLESDAAAREAWIESQILHQLLREKLGVDRGFSMLLPQAVGEASAGADEPTERPLVARALHATAAYLSHPARFALLVATVAVTSFLLTAAQIYVPAPQARPSRAVASSSQVARITRTHECRWAAGASAGHVADGTGFAREPLAAGTELELLAGLAEITFDSGARVLLEGPTKFRVESAEGSRLLHGRLTATVPSPAIGFWVETPHLRVIDRGTQFGVTLDEEGTGEVVVFQGAVDLAPVTRQSARRSWPTQRLIAGEARRVLPSRAAPQPVPTAAQKEDYIRQLPDAEPLIASVFSNNSRDYRVVAAGLYEDAPAFTDRAHQWNGVTSAGIPEYLLGADYVRVPTSEAKAGEVTVTLRVNRPATLYVFFRQELSPPRWLRTQFVDTGDLIGIDGGYPERGEEDKQLGRAAGVSIDSRYKVWKLDVRRPGKITLGPSAPHKWPSMFGLAAVERTLPEARKTP